MGSRHSITLLRLWAPSAATTRGGEGAGSLLLPSELPVSDLSSGGVSAPVRGGALLYPPHTSVLKMKSLFQQLLPKLSVFVHFHRASTTLS